MAEAPGDGDDVGIMVGATMPPGVPFMPPVAPGGPTGAGELKGPVRGRFGFVVPGVVCAPATVAAPPARRAAARAMVLIFIMNAVLPALEVGKPDRSSCIRGSHRPLANALWMKLPFRALAGALAFSLLLPMQAGAQPVPYEINAVLPLTGPAAFLGQAQLSALKVAEKLINSTGGIKGRPVKFVTFDDQSSPQIDLQLTTPLIARHVPIVIDGGPVAMCRAVLPLFATAGPVSYCTSPALYPPAGGFVFSSSASSEDETHALVNFMRSKHWKRVAILTPTDATGQEADRVLRELFALPENRGMTVVAAEHFAPNDITVAAQMAKIKDAHPDVMMAWGTGTATATEYRGLKDAGLNIPVVGSNGNQQYALMKEWANILPDEYYQYSMKWAAYKTISPGPIKNSLAAMYKAFAADGLRPDGGTQVIWDPLFVVVAALRTLPDQPTAVQMRDAILQTRGFAGTNGYYDFRVGNQRGLTIKDCIVVRWDKKTMTFIPVTGSAGLPA